MGSNRHIWPQIWSVHIGIRNTWQCRFGVRHEECIWVTRCYRHSGFILQIPEQIHTILFKGTGNIKTKRQEIYKKLKHHL